MFFRGLLAIILTCAQFCNLHFYLVLSHFQFLRFIEVILLSTPFLTTPSLSFPMNKNKPSWHQAIICMSYFCQILQNLLGMSSNTWGAERNHLKVTTKKEGVSERGVTRLVTNVSHADENKTLPLEGLCCITLPGGQSRNTHLFTWLTRGLTPAAAEVFAGCKFVFSVQFLPVSMRGTLESFPAWCVTGQSRVCCHCCCSGAPYKAAPSLCLCQEGFCKCPVPSNEIKCF